MNSLCSWLGLGCLLAFASNGLAAEPGFRVELRNREVITAPDFTATSNEVALSLATRPKVAWSEVVSIHSEGAIDDWSRSSSLIWLSNGDRIIGDPIAIDEETMTVRWSRFPNRDAFKIPLESVSAVCLKIPPSSTGRRKLFHELTKAPSKGDLAWLVSGDRVSGEFAGLDAGEFHFTTPTGKLHILRDKLTAIRFDPDLVSPMKSPETRSLLSLSDGSRLTVQRFERSAERISFQTIFGVAVVLPVDVLAACQNVSPQIQMLSSRKPVQFQMTPFLSATWPLVTDRNIKHGPLQLRGREFAFGLGTHSRSAVTYALDPADREFRAVVGIDDLAEGAGHVVFTVQLDDRVVWTSPGVTGLSDAVRLPPIKLDSAKRLTLTVEFGEHGDVRDYADWCDALILREP